MNLKNFVLLISLFLCFSFSSHEKKLDAGSASSTVKIVFKNKVQGSAIVLIDSLYTNPFNEKYSITKLRYYVTNICLYGTINNFIEKNSYHLIDESKEESQSLTITLPAGGYSSLHFLLGVDSLHNVSGAQTDDLDPTKDMFWTWNSGYVMAKMEGNSPASTLVNNKYEFHIGGYAGPSNVVKKIQLNLNDKIPVEFAEGKTTEIIINADINTWWQNPNDIRIAEHAIITSPGKNALAISDNYAKMFSIEKIIAE